MNPSVIPDFDKPLQRDATDAAKYGARSQVFGTAKVQPLWVADMDLPVAPFLQDALVKRVNHPCYGYTLQSSALKEAVQWWMREEHAVCLDSDSVLFSPSVVTTMSNAIAAFTRVGEGVALFSPVYERFYSVIRQQKRTVVNIPLLNEQNRYYLDLAVFEQACKAGKISMLLFCNPQNPGGRVWERQELTEVVRLCRKYTVLLFADEIHSDIIYLPNRHTSLLTISGSEKNTVLAHSIGKTFNCSGLEPSFVLIADATLRKRFAAAAQRTHTADINLLAKTAIQSLFSPKGQQYKIALVEYLRKNRDLLADQIDLFKGIDMMLPQATFLAWLDFRGTGLSHEQVRKKLITDAGIGLADGLVYGDNGEGWFRLNFAVCHEELTTAIAKLERVFSE